MMPATPTVSPIDVVLRDFLEKSAATLVLLSKQTPLEESDELALDDAFDDLMPAAEALPLEADLYGPLKRQVDFYQLEWRSSRLVAHGEFRRQTLKVANHLRVRYQREKGLPQLLAPSSGLDAKKDLLTPTSVLSESLNGVGSEALAV